MDGHSRTLIGVFLLIITLGGELTWAQGSAKADALDKLYGAWEGFAATPAKGGSSVVRIRLDLQPAPDSAHRGGRGGRPDRASVQAATPQEQREMRMQGKASADWRRQTSRTRKLFDSIDDSGYRLQGDEVADSFYQTVSATLQVEPLFYLAPGFEETEVGAQFFGRVQRQAEQISAEATLPAIVNTQTGQLRFGPGWQWVNKPRDDVLRPAALRLLFDARENVLFGELLNPNTAAARKRLPTPLQPVFLPVMLWRPGAVPEALMDRLGEEVNLARGRPDYRLTKVNQLRALQAPAPDEAQTVDKGEASDADNGRRDARRRKPEPAPEEDSAPAESEALQALRAAADAANAEEVRMQQAFKDATQARSDAAAARKAAEGDAYEAANQAYKDAQKRYNEFKRASVAAAKEAREARKALAAEESSSRDAARSRTRADRATVRQQPTPPTPSEDEGRRADSTPALPVPPLTAATRERALPDVTTTPERLIAWAYRLGEEVPELLVDDQIVLERWPNAGTNLFSDEATLAAFGQTPVEWSAGDRWRIVKMLEQLRGNGLSQEFVGWIDSEFERYFPRTLSRYYLQAQARRYADGVEAMLAEQPIDQLTFLRLAGWEEAAADHLAHLWPSQFNAINGWIGASRASRARPVLEARLDAAIATLAQGADGASLLADWWLAQDGLLDHIGQDDRKAVGSELNRALDRLLDTHLKPLTGEIKRLGKGLDAVLAGSALYARAQAITGRASYRPAYKEFIERLNARREKDRAEALPQLKKRLASIEDFDEVDELVADILVVPSDFRSGFGAEVSALADTRRAELDEAVFYARYSPRERELMVKPGVLKVPGEYTAPTAEEVKLAYYREMLTLGGMPTPRDPTSILHTEPVNKLFKMYMKVVLFDVEVLEVKEWEDGYAVNFAYKVKMTPHSENAKELFKELDRTPNLMTATLRIMMAYLEAVPSQEVHEFRLTASGWRSDTLRKQLWDGLASYWSSQADALQRALPRYRFRVIRRY
ncbi:MAG: hypothetical protein AAF184_13175 [Pseudomonadota bacterium]